MSPCHLQSFASAWRSPARRSPRPRPKPRITPPTEFEEAAIYVEQNATDGDTEVVISGTAGDEGLRRLFIKSPDREVMTTLLADDATPGMREFHFETPEPPGEAVLAFYPEGRYVLPASRRLASGSGPS